MVLKSLARLLDADVRPQNSISNNFSFKEIQKKTSSLAVAKREMNYAQKWKSSVFPLLNIFGKNYSLSFDTLNDYVDWICSAYYAHVREN